jgi:hypothetical protein
LVVKNTLNGYFTFVDWLGGISAADDPVRACATGTRWTIVPRRHGKPNQRGDAQSHLRVFVADRLDDGGGVIHAAIQDDGETQKHNRRPMAPVVPFPRISSFTSWY